MIAVGLCQPFQIVSFVVYHWLSLTVITVFLSGEAGGRISCTEILSLNVEDSTWKVKLNAIKKTNPPCCFFKYNTSPHDKRRPVEFANVLVKCSVLMWLMSFISLWNIYTGTWDDYSNSPRLIPILQRHTRVVVGVLYFSSAGSVTPLNVPSSGIFVRVRKSRYLITSLAKIHPVDRQRAI